MRTEKKNQHYVPKFYLRNFSIELNYNQIGLFNIFSELYVEKAKLKTQGCKNYYYGEDGILEDMLSNIEGYLATEIREIIERYELPKKGSSGHENLLYFIALMDLRNPTLIDYIRYSKDLLRQRLLGAHKDTDVNSLVPEISHEEAIGISLSNLGEVVKNLKDLEFKLLVNETKYPFITSDFPIAKYNQFLEKMKFPHGKTGYGNIGLQIFIPISPKLIILFYDAKIYKVGFKKQRNLTIKSTHDIDNLNVLQFLNSYYIVYFNHEVSKKYINEIFNRSKNFKKANIPKSKLAYIVKPGEKPLKNPSNMDKNLIIIRSTDCEINLDLAGITIHKVGKKKVLSNSVAQVREYSENRMRTNYR